MTNAFTIEQFNNAIAPRHITANADNERIIAKLAANGATVDHVPAFMESDKYKNLTGHVLRAFASWYYAENGKAPKAPRAPKAAKPVEPLPLASFDKFIQYEVKDKAPEPKPEPEVRTELPLVVKSEKKPKPEIQSDKPPLMVSAIEEYSAEQSPPQ